MASDLEKLTKLRDELVEVRVRRAYEIGSAHHAAGIDELVRVHLAIQALDVVIQEGRSRPNDPAPLITSVEAS